MADPRFTASIAPDGSGPASQSPVRQVSVQAGPGGGNYKLSGAGWQSVVAAAAAYVAGLSAPQLAAMQASKLGFSIHVSDAGVSVTSAPDGGSALVAAINAAITPANVVVASA
jgi:hypothetical protein